MLLPVVIALLTRFDANKRLSSPILILPVVIVLYLSK